MFTVCSLQGPLGSDYPIWTYTGSSSEALMPGQYTRYGDVFPLLQVDDNRFAVYGGGDQVCGIFLCSDDLRMLVSSD